MKFIKKTKNQIIKALNGTESVPRGLVELHDYFRLYKVIEFKNHHEGDMIVAVSKNFKYGSIVTSAKNEKLLEKKIQDAILTSFNIPSSYAKEAAIRKIGKEKKYAIA